MRYFIIFVCFFFFIWSHQATAKRLALVTGNDNYHSVEKLQKAVNDAKAVSETLKGLGFQVTFAKNVTRRKMNRVLTSFANKIEIGDEVLFYYAGHGIEILGRNYLLPVDIPSADPGNETFITNESFAVSGIISDLQNRGGRVNLIILDACRDNPFPKRGRRTLGGKRGLSRVAPPRGTFVMFSAGANQSALDRLNNSDPNPNSVYTRSLIPLLKTPGISMTQMAKRLRRDVEKLALTINHPQYPSYYDELNGEYFITPVRDDRVRIDNKDRDYTLWKSIENSKRISNFEFYLREFPKGRYSSVAKLRIKELKAEAERKRFVHGYTFKDCADCPSMIVVKGGSFMMGSPASEKGRRENEGPRREVRIANKFAVGRYEVTFAEWDACVADGGCKGYKPKDEGWGRGRRPVIYVSWDHAKAYVDWLSRKTGKTYRFLTEAEWEYVVRAGTTTTYNVGDKITKQQAQFSEGSLGSAKQTVPVGSFQPNVFGVYDVHGNVWEWVEDCYKNTYKGAPRDGSAWKSGNCNFRVLRGGSWFGYPRVLRSANRIAGISGYRSYNVGFRVSRTLGASNQ